MNQPIRTVGENDSSRVQEDIDVAIADGKRVGRPPFGYTVEDGSLQQIPTEYVRAQTFIREKHATATSFEIPDAAIQSILARAEANYDTPFGNDQWRLERARVQVGEKASSLALETRVALQQRAEPSEG